MTTSKPFPANPEGSDGANVPGRPWKRIAMYVGGGIGVVVLVGTTAAVTLAVTHDSAVRENLIAYLNGRIDGRDDLMSFLATHGFCEDLDQFF